MIGVYMYTGTVILSAVFVSTCIIKRWLQDDIHAYPPSIVSQYVERTRKLFMAYLGQYV